MPNILDGLSGGGGGADYTSGTFSGNVTIGDASGDTCTILATTTITPAVTLEGGVSGDFTYTGHKDNQIMLFNAWNIVSDWTNGTDGCARLAASKSAKKFVVPLSGLKVGDEIKGFRIVGQVESGGEDVVLDADLRKVTKGTADVTDASVGAIAQTTVSADTSIDIEKTFTAVTIASDYQYYVLVTSTTGSSTDVAIAGIEVDINRK